jgi:geranylgeranyl diphosphate synthase type I
MLGMLRYHLGWVDQKFQPIRADTGKRIRALLTCASCVAVGGDWRDVAPAAAGIELVHNFSLIHDDIEDDADERRGRSALWKIWGQAQGINAGDAMFVLARLALYPLADRPRYALVQHIFDQATFALTQGQYLDLEFESRPQVTLDDYFKMIGGKTAALISAATHIGAIVGTANATAHHALAQFGYAVGLAFQIVDDILGIWGDPALTGKSASSDIISKKKSLPAIYALSHSNELRTLYAKPVLAPNDVASALEHFSRVGAREYAQRLADGYIRQSLAALNPLSIESTVELRRLASSMVDRIK